MRKNNVFHILSLCLCDCVLSIALHTHPHIDARQHILGLTYKRIDYQQFVIEYIMNHLIGYGTYIFTRINVSQIKKCMRICIFAQYLNTRRNAEKKLCFVNMWIVSLKKKCVLCAKIIAKQRLECVLPLFF